jgi:PHP family Zn ribbon phosphoesterase
MTVPYVKLVSYVTTDVLNVPQLVMQPFMDKISERFHALSERIDPNSDQEDELYIAERYAVIRQLIEETTMTTSPELYQPLFKYLIAKLRETMISIFHHKGLEVVKLNMASFEDLDIIFMGDAELDFLANDEDSHYERALDNLLRVLENILGGDIDDTGPIYSSNGMLSKYTQSNQMFCMFSHEQVVYTNKDYGDAPDVIKERIINKMDEATLFCGRKSVIVMNTKASKVLFQKPITVNNRSYISREDNLDKVLAYVLGDMIGADKLIKSFPDSIVVVNDNKIVDTLELGYSLDGNFSVTRGTVWLSN